MATPKRRELTPAITEQVANFILAGAYPHVAAQAVGVPRAVFKRWLARGRHPGAEEPYRSFADRVLQAAAQARMLAETALFKKDPRTWLKSGPGKEGKDNPGWSKDVSPLRPTGDGSADLLASPQWHALWTQILSALADFPA